MIGDFIEVYENALDAQACDALLAAYAASPHITRGSTGGGVNTTLKDSWDVCISRYDEWRDAVNLLNTAVMQALLGYVRTYPFLALAPVTLNRIDRASGATVMLGVEDILAMSDERLRTLLAHVFRPGDINIQRYLADVGGYPYWHSEISPRLEGDTVLHRVLLWTIYLNDGFGEGETEFHFQQRKIAPRKGSLLLAPAGFTHTHRGNRPLGRDKFIATSWILFQRAEQLYADPRNANAR